MGAGVTINCPYLLTSQGLQGDTRNSHILGMGHYKLPICSYLTRSSRQYPQREYIWDMEYYKLPISTHLTRSSRRYPKPAHILGTGHYKPRYVVTSQGLRGNTRNVNTFGIWGTINCPYLLTSQGLQGDTRSPSILGMGHYKLPISSYLTRSFKAIPETCIHWG